jgi:Spy/CpxP family protein refolding chaperone
MRKTTVIALAALVLAACNDATGPGGSLARLDEITDLAFSASFAGDPSGNFLGPLNRLPENLKLSADQQTKVKALVDAFLAATKADHDALAAIRQQASDALKAGKSKAEVDAILATGAPIRERLMKAEEKLRADIFAVLTADQKAWLEANKRTPCSATPLTDAQKNQISALVAAFEAANKADLDAIKAAMEKARAAKASGASPDAIKAILDSVKANTDRIRAAEAALRTAIAALLTPDQLKCQPGALRGGLPKPPGR